MCCLPIAVTNEPSFKKGSVAGLVLESTGEIRGQYRRVGHFWCGRDYFDTIIAKVEPKSRSELLPSEWPLGEKKSSTLEDGYTISII